MNNNLWQVARYTTKTDFCVGQSIMGLDISKANINVLLWKNVISDEMYESLYNADKETRVITIGKMQRDNSNVTKVLQQGIAEIRRMLFEIFDIDEFNLLSVRNDGIYFINNKQSLNQQSLFKDIQFLPDKIVCQYKPNRFFNIRIDSTYTSFYRFDKKELFFNNGRFTGSSILDISGIGDISLSLHREYFIKTLINIFTLVEIDIRYAIKTLNTFYMDYINRRLPIGYYRRFDSFSRFQITNISEYDIFEADHLPESAIDVIDISYNEKILRQLSRMLSNIYFNKG